MEIKTVKNIMKWFVCLILFLQMINILIDPPDLKHFKKDSIIKEDSSVEEIKSKYQLISENFFYKNLPVSQVEDINTITKTLDVNCFTPTSNIIFAPDFSTGYSSCYKNNISVLYAETVFPPPNHVYMFT